MDKRGGDLHGAVGPAAGSRRVDSLGNYSRLTELDQILVCGSWMEATDVQVGFTQLLSHAATAATAIAAAGCGGGGGGVGAGRSHLMAGRRRIGLLYLSQEEKREEEGRDGEGRGK